VSGIRDLPAREVPGATAFAVKFLEHLPQEGVHVFSRRRMLREENLAAFHAAEQCDCLFPLCDRGRKQTEEFRLNSGEGAIDHANAVGIRGSRLQDKSCFRGC